MLKSFWLLACSPTPLSIFLPIRNRSDAGRKLASEIMALIALSLDSRLPFREMATRMPDTKNHFVNTIIVQ